jgi:flagellar protein FliS
MSTSALKSYQSITAHGNLAEASPYKVVQLMFDAILSRVAEAGGHLERGETQLKGEKIGKALGIIEALVLGLDKERGGEIATNLERLYDYMARTLLKANLENRLDLLKEVSVLLRELKLAWDGIAAAAGKA